MIVDLVMGLSYGDEGKGKVTHALLKSGEYSHTLRYNGGGNAGHTIYHKGKKFVTHLVPSGVFYGIPSIIGPGVVFHPKALENELRSLAQEGIWAPTLVARNAHLVTDQHKAEEVGESNIGTTRTGNGPAYRDKYARVGVRADSAFPESIDLLDFWMNNPDAVVLAEGAQAFGLDIDWGNYPYVTSSHCGVAGLLTSVPHKTIRHVWGVIKAYDTYVGAMTFQDPSDPVLDHIQQLGQEWGATTGRKRQVNYLDWDLTRRAILSNGVDNLVVNKVDILEEVDVWKIRHQGVTLDLHNKESFLEFIQENASKLGVQKVVFSFSPETL